MSSMQRTFEVYTDARAYIYLPPLTLFIPPDPNQLRRCLRLRPSTGFKGLTVLCVVAVVSLVMLLYARERVNTIFTSTFPHYYFTSSSPMSSAIELEAILPQVQHTPTDVTSDDETLAYGATEMVDPNETFQPMEDMILHYIWCGNRFLDFRNYVAMKSALDAIRPRQVYLHYDHLPMKDPHGYFTWFSLLQRQFGNFVMMKVNSTIQPECHRHGGIYMPEDAIFLRIPDRFRFESFVSGITSCSLNFFFEGIMIAQCNSHNKDVLRPCTPEARFRESPESQPSCVRLQTSLFPKDVWNVDDRLANLTKMVAYGKTDVRPKRSSLPEDRVPRIAHYLCTDDCVISFSTYLSILSALNVGGLDRALIHGPTQPSGVWWQRLQSQHRNTVLHLHREFSFAQDPSLQMTNDMRRYIMRAEILAHYGGVFHDSHVIWTQQLPDELLEYETVISPDWHAHGNWPESVNHALLIARGGARYLQQLLKVYQENANSPTPWIAEHYLSYRLIEVDPTLAHLYPHLQVKCLNHNCHPTWQPNYRSHYRLNRPGGKFDWRKETLSVHWVDSFPELDVDQVKFSRGIIVDIARHVLAASSVDINTL
ncbi:hypothetical protein BaRGS_00006975 [Batillaria attramentaria]|uniref:Uncharacterized protein n=1 Tax=Batillaria attramentaria TaxID=370345 RepID=A0ABD0LQC4_9CAEN